jgi:hypothetical protein
MSIVYLMCYVLYISMFADGCSDMVASSSNCSSSCLLAVVVVGLRAFFFYTCNDAEDVVDKNSL